MGGIETTSPTTLLPERAPWALSSGRYLCCDSKTAKNKSQTSVARNICTSIKDKGDLQHLLGFEVLPLLIAEQVLKVAFIFYGSADIASNACLTFVFCRFRITTKVPPR